MEFIFGFFAGLAVYGFWFWALILVEFGLLLWFVEEEWPLPSIVSFVIFILLLWWLADIPVWTWIKENPWNLLKYAGVYVIAGLGWSFFKYYFHLNKMKKHLVEIKDHWRADVTSDKPNFESYLKDRSYGQEFNFERSASKLLFWAMWWPPSLIWTVLNDPVRKFFKWLIFTVFVGAYRKMYDRMIGSVLRG